MLSDLALSRRLERAEGYACVQFARTRARLFPESGAAWAEHAGGYLVFDGVDSPITQSFALGILEDLTGDVLNAVEPFFQERGAPVLLEVCPLAGVAALNLLCDRGYRPLEISSVLYRPVPDVGSPSRVANDRAANVRAYPVEGDEGDVWTDVNVRGWSHEHPEIEMTLRELCGISAHCEDTLRFLGEVNGVPAAAGSLSLHEGVALFSGSSTVPELRRHGLQGALLEARMRYAAAQGCDLAMMVAEAGSSSQRNAERKGFRIAYTRTKWRLAT